MKVYTSLNDFPRLKNAIVTIGTFDGVHVGHQKIIQRLKELADEEKGEMVILTFFPHPRMILHPDDLSLKLLNTIDEKISLLRSAGVHNLIIHPFSREFSELRYDEFVKSVLVDTIGLKKIVIGYDHHFGKGREGGFEQLKALSGEHGFKLEEIPEQDINNIAVSSSKIRAALFEGDISTANMYLGHDYSLEGKVIKGKQLGRKLGFPTANLEIQETYKLIPADGIYAVMVKCQGQVLKGMMSIGMNPTVNGTDRSLEVNILDFNEDIYGHQLKVFFKARLRGEEKFSSLDALKDQMEIDRQVTIKLLS